MCHSLSYFGKILVKKAIAFFKLSNDIVYIAFLQFEKWFYGYSTTSFHNFFFILFFWTRSLMSFQNKDKLQITILAAMKEGALDYF